MNISSAQLMKMLSSGVRPVDGQSTTGASSATPPGAFADLLKQAQQGDISSQLPVTLAADAEGVALNPDQLARLSLAADKLETAGIRTALITIDGQKLLLDVHARQVLGKATAENGVTSGIDGVLDLGDARLGAADANAQQSPDSAASALAAAPASARLPVPSAALAGNPDVLKLLASLNQASAA